MAGQPSNNGAPGYRSYYDYLGSSFVHHVDNLPEKLNPERELPRPLDADRYWDDQESDQSNTCAKLAVDFYNQQEGNSSISLDHAKDSHKFRLNGSVYFHVNFKAVVRRHEQRYTFFAEVMGQRDHPEDVTMVVLFQTKEDRMTRDNCLYCTGLRHPEEGGFAGQRHAPADLGSEEEDGDEEDEEEDGDEEDEEEDGD